MEVLAAAAEGSFCFPAGSEPEVVTEPESLEATVFHFGRNAFHHLGLSVMFDSRTVPELQPRGSGAFNDPKSKCKRVNL